MMFVFSQYLGFAQFLGSCKRSYSQWFLVSQASRGQQRTVALTGSAMKSMVGKRTEPAMTSRISKARDLSKQPHNKTA